MSLLSAGTVPQWNHPNVDQQQTRNSGYIHFILFIQQNLKQQGKRTNYLHICNAIGEFYNHNTEQKADQKYIN